MDNNLLVQSNEDAQVEEQLLGALLLNPSLASSVVESVPVNAFNLALHREIYSCILEIAANGEEPNLTKVEDYCRTAKVGQQSDMPAGQVLAGCISAAGIGDNLISLGEVIRKRHIRREFASWCIDANQRAAGFQEVTDVFAAIERISSKLHSLSSGLMGEKPQGLQSLEYAMADFVDFLDGGESIKTGIEPIDDLCNFDRGDLAVLAARPSMGKTWLSLVMAYRMAMNGLRCCFFSVEMKAMQLFSRLVSHHHGEIPSTYLRPECMGDESIAGEIMTASAQLTEAIGDRLHVDEASSFKSIDYFRRQLDRYCDLTGGVDVIFLDHLHLVSDKRASNPVEEIGYWSKAFKSIAKDYNAVSIVLSQLSRNCETRNDKRPILSDLRASGDVEQDADLVMMLYRDAYYNHDIASKDIEFLVRKNRKGQCGAVTFGMDLSNGRISYDPPTSRYI